MPDYRLVSAEIKLIKEWQIARVKGQVKWPIRLLSQVKHYFKVCSLGRLVEQPSQTQAALQSVTLIMAKTVVMMVVQLFCAAKSNVGVQQTGLGLVRKY